MMSKNPPTQVELEAEYREKFETLKEDMNRQVQTFIAESIINNSFESPEMKAQLDVYKPIVESVVKALKESGILNAGKGGTELPDEVVSVITEQTEMLNNQSNKIKELKMRMKLYEMITENLAGLDKEIIREAVTKFQGEDNLNEDELLKKLTSYISNRKPSSKTVQFEAINTDIDEVDAILEGTSGKSASGKFSPKKKINMPGIRPRVVTESVEVRMPDDEGNVELDPASEFMRDFGHIGT